VLHGIEEGLHELQPGRCLSRQPASGCAERYPEASELTRLEPGLEKMLNIGRRAVDTSCR
jgi:hypothetical protein